MSLNSRTVLRSLWLLVALPSLAESLLESDPIHAEQDPCHICGEGNDVGNPDAALYFSRNGLVKCGDVHSMSASGHLHEQFCSFVILMAEQHCCAVAPPSSRSNNHEPAPKPTDTTAPSATPSSTPLTSPQSEGFFPSCNLCGDDGRLAVTSPNTLIQFPNQSPVSCQELELVAFQGFLTPQHCVVLQELVFDECGCASIGSGTTRTIGPAPTAAPSPSSVPTASPTTLPSFNPTAATPNPTVFPTSAPFTEFPTVVPTTSPAEAPTLPNSPGFPICYVCGQDFSVMNADVIIALAEGVNTRCDDVEHGALNGFVNPVYCPLIMTLARPCCIHPGIMTKQEGQDNATTTNWAEAGDFWERR